MPKQKQSTTTATAAKAQKKPAPMVVQEMVAAPEGTGLIAVTGVDSLQTAVTQLGSGNLQRVQRQMVAGSIGQQQGNGRLQEVMSFVRQSQPTAPYQSNKAGVVARSTTSNGHTRPAVRARQQQLQLHESEVAEETSIAEDFAQVTALDGAHFNDGDDTADPVQRTLGKPHSLLEIKNTPSRSTAVPEKPTVQRSWWDSAKRFGRGIAGAATNVAKLALGPVAKLARTIPGYSLLAVVLGKDPISDQEVPSNAMSLVQGIASLIPGGEKLFKNLQESNTLQTAFEWIQGQLQKLNLTWATVKGLFTKAWSALSATDFMPPTKAFHKVKGIFLPLIVRIKNFAVAVANKIWEMAFEGALKLAGSGSGKVLAIIKRAGGAFSNIIKDPVGFLGRLISGVGQGFQNFGGNITKHLKTGLVGWLTGAVRGINLQLPEDVFSPPGIFSLVTQVLGLTWDYIRGKAVKQLGERVVSAAEAVFTPFKVLVTDGPAGLWEYVQDQFGDLKELVMDQIQGLLQSQVIQAGIKWVLKLLSPASALMGAAISIYEIVMFVVERAGQLTDFVNSVVNSIAAIARGAVGGAANLIENSLAKALPLVIGFLANLLNIGDLAEKVMGIIRKVRAKIDGVIERLILKVKKFFRRGKGKDETLKNGQFTEKDRQKGLRAFDKEEKKHTKNGHISLDDARKTAHRVKQKHPVFETVAIADGGDSWNYQYVFRSPDPVDTGRTKTDEELFGSGERPGWESGLDRELRKKYPHRYELIEKDGRRVHALKKGMDRRHIIPWDIIKGNYTTYWQQIRSNQNALKEAAILIKDKSKGAIQVGQATPLLVNKALKRLAKKANNDPDNLWVGGSKENRRLGNRYYDTPHEWDRKGTSKRDRLLNNLIRRFKRRWFF